ncbi:Transforming acidic coiled-coil-containing protein 3 [Nymphon striatum]|nr:Transforming acidic coiled-coil-containing protein 3 [Nymphon striatum]
MTTSLSDSTNPTIENSEIIGGPEDEVSVTPGEPCFDFDIEFDENFDPFATSSNVSSSPTKKTLQQETAQIMNKNLSIEAKENSFSNRSESVEPVTPADWLQNLYQQLPHDDGCNTVMKYEGKILVDRKLQDARETEESSEDSGIQIFMPTKKGSREEESSNISSKTAQSHHSFENNVTKRGDSSPIEDFGALNINDTDFKQKISENNNDIKDEDTSLKNQSEAGPDIAEFTDEEFKSAVEFFKDPAAFEFLQKAGNSKTFEQSTLARMSLYVKFDPLLKQDSPTRRTSMQLQNEASRSATQEENDSSTDGLCKLIDFSPSPKKVVSQTDKHAQEVTKENPNMEMPGNNDAKLMSKVKKTDIKAFTEEEMNQALKMQELLYQERLLKKDKQWNEKCKNANRERDLESSKVNSLHESQSQMTQIIAEFEKTISDLITHKESDMTMMQSSIDNLKRERDQLKYSQALEDLQGVETSFSDLHRRFEKSKSVLEGFKKNEEILHETVEQYQQKFKKAEQKYELLKNYAEKTLEEANQEIMNVKKSNESEIIVLQAQLKKSEMKINSLERAVQEKTKEAAELSSICDDLIQKVGHS